MPSDKTTDERAPRALDVLAKARENFHSALVATSEELRGLLDAGSATAEARAERTAAELGAFAVGHIDIERFASFQEAAEPTQRFLQLLARCERCKRLPVPLVALAVTLEAVILIFRAVEIKAVPLTGSEMYVYSKPLV